MLILGINAYLLSDIDFYYPTVLVTVQKAREPNTNMPRYCTVGHWTVGYCTVPRCALILLHL